MTALTGETGAGKTLLVEALQLVLGGRGSPGLVRAGADEALVEARFELAGEDDGEPTEVLVARSLPAHGRSRAWIDGRMAPLSALSELAPRLLDIHGQHEQHSLLAPSAQRRALDAFAGTDAERAAVRAATARLADLDARLSALGGDTAQRARELDVLAHQIAEIDGASIVDPDEEATLAAEVARLSDLSALRQAAAGAYDALLGAAPASPGASERLGEAVAALGDRAPLAAWEARLRAAAAEVDDIAVDLRAVVDTWDDDPARLEAVLARQRALADLRHKYGPTLADVLAFVERARAERDQLDGAEATAARLEAERAAATAESATAATALRARRQQAAPGPGRRRGRSTGVAGHGWRPLRGRGGRDRHGRPRALPPRGERRGVAPADPQGGVGRGAGPGHAGPAAGGGGRARHHGLRRGRRRRRGTGGAGPGRRPPRSGHRAPGAGGHPPAPGGGVRRPPGGRGQVGDRRGRTATSAAVLGPDERVVELARMLSGQPDSATARAHAEELLSWAADAATSTTDRAGVV